MMEENGKIPNQRGTYCMCNLIFKVSYKTYQLCITMYTKIVMFINDERKLQDQNLHENKFWNNFGFFKNNLGDFWSY